MNNISDSGPIADDPPDVSLTSDAYRRWLRAHSPQPLSFFLGLTELEQETLAGLGEEYDEDNHLGLAWAIRDPEAALFGATNEGEDDDDLSLEEALVQRIATNVATRSAQVAQDAPGLAQPRKPLTMGGITERRLADELEVKQAHNNGRRLFGREPDEATV